jgi:iron-sulfur cluster assembly accessory protein
VECNGALGIDVKPTRSSEGRQKDKRDHRPWRPSRGSNVPSLELGRQVGRMEETNTGVLQTSVETRKPRLKASAEFSRPFGPTRRPVPAHTPITPSLQCSNTPFRLKVAFWRLASHILAVSAGIEIRYKIGNERLVKVTERAAAKLSQLLTRQGRPDGALRVAVIGGGCSGLQYKMDLVDGPANRDILVESNRVRVVVDPKTALFVSGSSVDFSEDLQKGGFKVTNPNAVAHCSCGESFSA